MPTDNSINTNGRLALKLVAEASTDWCSSIQQSQINTANCVNCASQLLMELYSDAKTDLDARMETASEYYDTANGGKIPSNVDAATGKVNGQYYFMPDSDKDKNNYQQDVTAWQTQYSNTSQQYTNAENEINTPISSMDTQVESLGNAAQQAVSMGGTAIKPNSTLASLLGSAL